MRRLLPLFLLLVCLFTAIVPAGVAQLAESPPLSPNATDINGNTVITTQLSASHNQATAGQTIDVAWQFKLAPTWHVYWQNAGDSGLPPSLSSAMGTLSPLTFPQPEVISLPPLTNYGYHKQVTFTASLTLPTPLAEGPLEIPLSGNFLYCSDICMPATVALSLPITIGAESIPNPAFKPQQVLPVATTQASASMDANHFTLQLPTTHTLAKPWFIPAQDGVIDDSAPQDYSRLGRSLSIARDSQSQTSPTTLEGIVIDEANPQQVGYNINTVLTPAVVNPTASLTFATALGFAFLAGLILNLMPCVLPVLALKVLSLVKHHHGPRRQLHTMAYTFGTLGTFAALGLMVSALQAAGYQLGWGFHLQNPVFVGVLAGLMVVLGLQFWGVIHLGGALTRLGLPHNPQSVWNSFGTGVLAVVVATPCTVPFMGGAMAYALTQPTGTTLAIFLMLGLGMATPFIAFTLLPQSLKLLPKPGRWMHTFQRALALPMFATALWLLWVLMQQISPPAPPPANANWQPWSVEKVAQAQANRQKVFVDFTASWCITCKVVEATILNTHAAQSLFKQHNVLLLRADWTRQDANISAELAKHGRQGVPLYLLYQPGQTSPQILPQIPTVPILREALDATNKPK